MKLSICLQCRHLFPPNPKRTAHCAAFPVEEIPLPIILGDIQHTSPYPGDHGIQYEPIEAAGGKDEVSG